VCHEKQATKSQTKALEYLNDLITELVDEVYLLNLGSEEHQDLLRQVRFEKALELEK